MRIVQHHIFGADWSPPVPQHPADLLLVFGCRSVVTPELRAELSARFPSATLVGCTTAGNILGTEIFDVGAILTIVSFERSRVAAVWAPAGPFDAQEEMGAQLMQSLPHQDLRHVLLLSDGLGLSAEALLRGLDRNRPAGVTVSGGCAGDGERFGATEVWLGTDGGPGCAVLCGFYGPDLEIKWQQGSGWEGFGPVRRITRADGATLFELDGKPALDLYRRYLGDLSSQLPAAAWRFPLGACEPGEAKPLVRSLISFDENAQSMTFASAMQAGGSVQMMRAGREQLLDAARGAAEAVGCGSSFEHGTYLGLTISCFGRRVLLGQRTFEELEAAAEGLGDQTTLCGFYSYGEMATTAQGLGRLLNQSFTLTLIGESRAAEPVYA